jgi:hypothetical protein
MNIYHFKRAAISGSQRVILNSPPLVGTYANDSFGTSVDFNSTGNICVIGNPQYDTIDTGAVKVYRQNPSTLLWEQLGSTITGVSGERIGYSVSITDDGYRIIVGSEGSNVGNGSIYVYDYDGTAWVKTSTITGQGIGYWSGFSVAINGTGNTVAFGSPKDDGAPGTDKGSVVIYRERLGVWTKIGTLYGELVEDNSGWSIALNSIGNILVVGAPFNDVSAVETGHTRVYQYSGPSGWTSSPLPTTWTQLGSDIDGTPNSQSGFSVACNDSGTMVVIGNILDSTISVNGGVVKAYRYISGSWVQYGDAIAGAAGDLGGYSISLNNTGNELAVSYPFKDSSIKADTGAVEIYKLSNSKWRKTYPRIPGVTAGEKSGWSLALSKTARNIIIGTPNYVQGGNKIGIARIYTLPQPFAFWDFNYTVTSTLTSFRVTAATSPSITIKWGDGAADTTTTSGTPVNHTYTI